MTDIPNTTRAAWAKAAVMAYCVAKEDRFHLYGELADVASDLFTDLLHLFDTLGVDPEKMIERARDHHRAECTGEGEAPSERTPAHHR